MKNRGNFSRAVDELMSGKFGSTEQEGDAAPPDVADTVAAAPHVAAPVTFMPGQPSIPPVSRHGSGEEARITADMTINGSITAKADIKISGNVIGDVKTDGSLTVDGGIEGQVDAGSILLNGATLKGNVNSATTITVAQGSTINGDVQAERIEVDASITGNILSKGTVILRANAKVQGSITAASLSMAEGAEWKGDVEIVKSRS